MRCRVSLEKRISRRGEVRGMIEDDQTKEMIASDGIRMELKKQFTRSRIGDLLGQIGVILQNQFAVILRRVGEELRRTDRFFAFEELKRKFAALHQHRHPTDQMNNVQHVTLFQRVSSDRHAINIARETRTGQTNFVSTVDRTSKGRRAKNTGRVTLNIVDLSQGVKDIPTGFTDVRLKSGSDQRGREELTFFPQTETNATGKIHALVDEHRKRIQSIARENRLKEIHFLVIQRLIPTDHQGPEHSLTRESRKGLANQQRHTIQKSRITLQRHLTTEHLTLRHILLQPVRSDPHELLVGRRTTVIVEGNQTILGKTHLIVVLMEEGITNGEIDRLHLFIAMGKAKGKETSANDAEQQRQKAKESKHFGKNAKIFFTIVYISAERTALSYQCRDDNFLSMSQSFGHSVKADYFHQHVAPREHL